MYEKTKDLIYILGMLYFLYLHHKLVKIQKEKKDIIEKKEETLQYSHNFF